MDIPLTAISATILLLVLQLSSAAVLNPSGQTTPSVARASADGASVDKAAPSQGGRDLAEALERLVAGQIGTALSAKRSAAGTPAGSSRQSGGAATEKDRTPAGLEFDVADYGDDLLLARLAQIEADVRDATSPAAADDGASDEDLYELLDRVLPSLGYKTQNGGGAVDAAAPSRRGQSERRMFTNGGSRGKKEEPDAAGGGGGLSDIVSELVGAVRELALRHVVQKERTDAALTILAEVVESLVSRRGD